MRGQATEALACPPFITRRKTPIGGQARAGQPSIRSPEKEKPRLSASSAGLSWPTPGTGSSAQSFSDPLTVTAHLVGRHLMLGFRVPTTVLLFIVARLAYIISSPCMSPVDRTRRSSGH